MDKTRIMVVEDEGIVAHDIARQLTDMGYDVVGIADSGEAAEAKAGELHPDLVLMDIVLSGRMDGIAAADVIRSRWDIPVVFLTAYADQKLLERAKLVYPFGYILKPFQKNDLMVALEIALYISGMERDKRRTEETLRRSEENFRRSIDESPLGIRIATEGGETIYVNRVLLEIYGYDSMEELNATPIRQRYTPESYAEFQARKEKRNKGEDVPPGYEVSIVRKDGEIRRIEVLRKPVLWDGENQYQAIYQDITERRRSEEAFLASRQQLRDLAGRLQAVREEEQTRIAREIHDELGGALTGLKIDFSMLTRAAAKIEDQTVRKSLLDGMESMTGSIDKTIQTVRRIAMELRPGILDDLGLVAALEWQLNDFNKRTGIRCDFVPPQEEMSFGPDLSTALFRICQEALTNVARHSWATEVSVRLRVNPDTLVLEVEDNGRGIGEEGAGSRKSLGLLGMRERAQMFGGRVTVSGTPGQGTTVSVEIPLAEKRKIDRDRIGDAG